jgi:hypothetical protein
VGPEASGLAPLGETEWISMLLKAEIFEIFVGWFGFESFWN